VSGVSDYDEFGLFHENIDEFDLTVTEISPVVRVETVVGDDAGNDRTVSSLRWGAGSPELVLVHGGAQNAHTWDTVALGLGRPLLAVDLPGHGHSDWRADGAYTPMNLADDLAVVIERHAPDARAVVGMSLGGMTSMELAVRHPHLVRSLVMVDITPGVNAAKTKAVIDFVDGPQSFPSFDDLLARTMEFNPTRSESSLRRGILHNALQLDDGSWVWRHRRDDYTAMGDTDEPDQRTDISSLWSDLESCTAPVTLVRGLREQSVVDDADVAELRRRRPDATVVEVDAGHSVQGDQPLELARIINDALHEGAT